MILSNPTSEQKQAIETSGKNIIVSAGAGSGKTFVLKERVLREVTDETTVDKLIILTFTNNAAAEMKDRIRKIISKNESVSDQLDLVDSAYITTFDSFAQSLVKKYNYLLNINKDFTIIDSNIVDMELNNILDKIFLDYYTNSNSNFDELINNYCYKSDDDLKSCIIKMYRELLNITNRDEFLKDYISIFFSDEKINSFIKEYDTSIFNKLDRLVYLFSELLDYTLTDKGLAKNTVKLNSLEVVKTKDDLRIALNLPTAKNSGKSVVYEDDSLSIRNEISTLEKEISNMIKYSDDELITQYKSLKNSISIIIDILRKLDKEIIKFKEEHNAYEFADIAFKAIELVRDNEEVRNEIKNNTYEIMIDEYQDTSDIQETFISYISNNNVYMVGDVKQSIYRFRNANPYIFKEKYDSYKDGELGYKIDLTNNFRSRSEVINNINDLFSTIMFDNVGGAKYKEEHCMGSGNQSYLSNKIDDYNYNMEIFSYKKLEDKSYNQAEIEAFMIAKDILNKINSKMKVMDGDGNFNEITYSDFCILIDKSKNFELVKKILEYHSIPATIYKDLIVDQDDEVFILKNLISLLTHINTSTYDEVFNHAYMSIGRSYIFKMSDEELFNILTTKSYKETALYKKLENISNNINGLSNKEILVTLINEFDIINKLILVGDVANRSKKLEYFINQADGLNKFGLDIFSLEDYFNQIIDGDHELKMSGKNASSNAVKIMTIHGSKGLEFPIVYMPFLDSRFSRAKQDTFMLTRKYGFILPYNDGTIDDTFIKTLYSDYEEKENISEKIRLLYVAITRAREKFIMISEFNDKIIPLNNIGENDLLRTKSYTDMLSLLKLKLSSYIKDIDVLSLNLSKDYNISKDTNYNDLINKVSDKITTKELNINHKILESKHFSKPLSKVIDKEFRETLDYGTFMHYAFEVFDFKNNNIDELDLKDDEKKCIINFLNHPETENIKNAITYKEHEIRFSNGDSIYHGFIDLLVEYDDHFDIIDYKLSNIDSPEYKLQLSGYKDYIESKYNKPTNIYLYSIKKDVFKKLN